MSKLHPGSLDCTKSELDLFEAPSTQTSLTKADWYEFPPYSTINEHGPLEFYVSGAGNEYIDLLHTQLYLKARIVSHDGTVLTKENLVTPVNYFLSSLFSQVEVTLNGRSIGHANTLYPYRAMIETLLNYSTEGTKNHLQSALFFKDTAAGMDGMDARYPNPTNFVDGFDPQRADFEGYMAVADEDGNDNIRGGITVPQHPAGNHGMYIRWVYSRGSQWVELMGPIHTDIFQQEKFLINNVDMSLKFHRSKPEICLLSNADDANFKIEIQDASLFIRKVGISDHVFLAQQHALLAHNAIYPVNYVTMKSFSIPRGNLVGPQDNLFIGQLPQEMVICFVDNDASGGNYVKNPFNFKHMDIRYMVVKYGGVQIPAKALTFNFDPGESSGGTYIRAYQQLHAASGRIMRDRGSLIQRNDFPRGYALFAFDFRPDIGCRGHYSLQKTGSVQVEIEFRRPLDSTINMIVYAAFDNFFEITSSRELVSTV